MASSQESRLEEMQRTAQAMATLASDEKAFAEAVEAVRTENTEMFQAVLGRVGLLGDCHLVCSYLCTKHCVWLCRHLVGRLQPDDRFIFEGREVHFQTVFAPARPEIDEDGPVLFQ